MAHNEFRILTALVGLLDHERNDIYIHFDKKVERLPTIECKHSNLFILKERIDNRWGTGTQIRVEFLIFAEAAKHGPYEYYHLLSGVDLPIKPMRVIHEFFENAGGGKFVELTEDSEKYAIKTLPYSSLQKSSGKSARLYNASAE